MPKLDPDAVPDTPYLRRRAREWILARLRTSPSHGHQDDVRFLLSSCYHAGDTPRRIARDLFTGMLLYDTVRRGRAAAGEIAVAVEAVLRGGQHGVTSDSEIGAIALVRAYHWLANPGCDHFPASIECRCARW